MFRRPAWKWAMMLGLFLGGLSLPSQGFSQDAEDYVGNWFIYNGTFRFTDHWSIFTEAHLRLFQLFSNVDETILRITGHYDISQKAMVGLGYVRADSWPFDKSAGEGVERVEHRIYQQFAIRHAWDRSLFEHRYRTEQRWLVRDAGTEYSNRLRYRIQVTTPLNRKVMERGTWFLNFYNEVFLNWNQTREFDQNRLYLAGGYQFTPLSNLQIGMMWQARRSTDFLRIQVFYTHNFDFRKTE